MRRPKIDGASALAGASPITLAHDGARILVVVRAFGIMLAFKVFDEVYLLTSGGPGTATEVVSFTIYQRFFTEDRAGYGSAMSIAVIFRRRDAASCWRCRRGAGLRAGRMSAGRRIAPARPARPVGRSSRRRCRPRPRRSGSSRPASAPRSRCSWASSASRRCSRTSRGPVLEDLGLPATTSATRSSSALASTALVLAVATLAAWSLHRMRWPRWVRTLPRLGARVPHDPADHARRRVVHACFAADRSRQHLHRHHPRAHDAEPADGALADGRLRRGSAARARGGGGRRRRLDAASCCCKVVAPLVAPGLAATGVLTFVFSWNEFPVALTLSTKQTATVPVAIAKFAQDFEIHYTQMAAARRCPSFPPLLLLLVGQRFIVKGLTAGAVK